VGDSTPETLAALLRDEPDPLKAFPALEKIVKRCLEKNPSGRYQAMSELKAELEKAVKLKATVNSEESQPSIAVLPFVNMSGDKEQEYFSDGLAEEIINSLTKIPGLKVAGRTSSFYFRDKDVEFEEIGKRLRVEHILEGSVRKSGNRIRITAQLVKVSDGFHLWSERYDRELTDVFAIQDEISQAIAEKLSVQFSWDRPPVKRHTDNIEAYNLYLKGHYQLHKYTAESLDKSKEYLEKAIALDPNYAPAWFGLAETDWYRGFIGSERPKTANEHARKATLKALELNEMLPEAHAMKAILHYSEFDWKEVEREFLRALKLSEGSSLVWWTYSLYYLCPMRRFDEAVSAARNALELDPLSPLLHWQLGHRYFYAEKFDRAIEEFQNALELDPQYNQAYSMLGIIYCLTGKTEEGIEVYETSVALGGNSSYFLGLLAFAYLLADRTDD
jgi:adenylate cyclase